MYNDSTLPCTAPATRSARPQPAPRHSKLDALRERAVRRAGTGAAIYAFSAYLETRDDDLADLLRLTPTTFIADDELSGAQP